jgi:mRNA interferase YafQ
MTRRVEPTKAFRRDFRREKSGVLGPKLDNLIMEVVDLLAADQALPARFQDHPMVGTWNDHRDCHVRPDLVLIYRKKGDDVLQLVRLGSHSELGI